MRIFPYMIATGLLAVVLAGCGGEKKNDNIITLKTEKKGPAAPIRMQDYTQSKDIEWLGSTYTCEIRRTADDSLAMVKDESGQQFVDNRISLEIIRSDGSTFFKKVFTKADFESNITDDYNRTGILEGLVFDKTDGQSLLFAASVSHPQTDEYIPLIVSVSRTGGITVSKDTQLDTSAEDDDDI